MKIIVTGSLGNISRPLATTLVEQGHTVTVISSNAVKQKDIEALGATAAIGSLEDAGFLTTVFTGADAAYCMVPPNYYHDHNLDLMAFYRRIGSNYAQAIRQSGIRRVVQLSSIGAHLEQGSGLILGHHSVEKILNDLPDVAITFIRPTSFYYNLYGYIAMIKKEGFIAANYGGEDRIVWVSPLDIAAAVAEELGTPLAGRKTRYVASDALTGNDTARIIGAAIGKPDLKWVVISDKHMLGGLMAAGMKPDIAAGLVEMYASVRSGVLEAGYYRNKPAVMGRIKMADFAQEFAPVFSRNELSL